MKKSTIAIIDKLLERKNELNYLRKPLLEATEILCNLKKNEKILLCGNGGSMADCEHMAGELNKGFKLKRKMEEKLFNQLKKDFPEDAENFWENLQCGIPAIPLGSMTATCTAYLNDCNPELVFAQGVFSLGRANDVLICISTSGNSKNVLYAAKLAKVLGLKVIAFTGKTGGKLLPIADVLLNVPSIETYLVQEYHLPIYHSICLAVENELFGE